MKYIETHSTDPYMNLAIEEYILLNRKDDTYVMLWRNDNTIVVGLNQNTMEEINLDAARKHSVNVVRRSTGGGTVYHDLGNVNYSIISDEGDNGNTIEYFTVPVVNVLKKMGLDASLSGRNDILVEGRKVSGIAERVADGRILHHGCLLFDCDLTVLSDVLNVKEEKFKSKSVKSVRSRVANIKEYLSEGMTTEDFMLALREGLLGESFEEVCLTAEEFSKAEEIANSKYRTWEWNYGKSGNFEFRNSARFNEGSLDICINFNDGRITDIVFEGDYMARCDDTELIGDLCGEKYDRESISRVLDRHDTSAIFGGIDNNKILELMFPK